MDGLREGAGPDGAPFWNMIRTTYQDLQPKAATEEHRAAGSSSTVWIVVGAVVAIVVVIVVLVLVRRRPRAVEDE